MGLSHGFRGKDPSRGADNISYATGYAEGVERLTDRPHLDPPPKVRETTPEPVEGRKRLACLLYLLMRDDITPGKLVGNINCFTKVGAENFTYSNKHLAAMAKEYASRILDGPTPENVSGNPMNEFDKQLEAGDPNKATREQVEPRES